MTPNWAHRQFYPRDLGGVAPTTNTAFEIVAGVSTGDSKAADLTRSSLTMIRSTARAGRGDRASPPPASALTPRETLRIRRTRRDSRRARRQASGRERNWRLVREIAESMRRQARPTRLGGRWSSTRRKLGEERLHMSENEGRGGRAEGRFASSGCGPLRAGEIHQASSPRVSSLRAPRPGRAEILGPRQTFDDRRESRRASFFVVPRPDHRLSAATRAPRSRRPTAIGGRNALLGTRPVSNGAGVIIPGRVLGPFVYQSGLPRPPGASDRLEPKNAADDPAGLTRAASSEAFPAELGGGGAHPARADFAATHTASAISRSFIASSAKTAREILAGARTDAAFAGPFGPRRAWMGARCPAPRPPADRHARSRIASSVEGIRGDPAAALSPRA